MTDPKKEQYVPCPKCDGKGDASCTVCHGLKTIPKRDIDFMERRDLKKILYTKPPTEGLEEAAQAPTHVFSPTQKRRKEPIEHELFAVGDVVRWKYPKPVLIPDAEPFVAFINQALIDIYEYYGIGPFVVIEIGPNSAREDFDHPEELHPQMLYLANSESESLPMGEDASPLSGDRFTKVR